MTSKNLYIISGCNGAGKTTASYSAKGGHDISQDIIKRRYATGINNLFKLFMPIVDYWAIFDNSETPRKNIAIGGKNADAEIYYSELYEKLLSYVK